MFYVTRDGHGRIESISAHPLETFSEVLPIEHPDIEAFLKDGGKSEPILQALQKSDIEVSRVTEDLIDLLIDRNVIRFTDLPLEAQRKLMKRQTLRGRLRDVIELVSEDDVL